MAELNANLKGVDENDAGGGDWRALPAGEYVCEISESDYKQTQAGNGMVLKLKFAVLEEGFQGKSFYDNLTLEHPKPQTVQIAKARLKQLAIGCGLPNPEYVERSEDLHSLPVLVKLNRVKGRNSQFCDSDGFENNVIGYRLVSQRGQNGGGSFEPPPHSDSDIPF